MQGLKILVGLFEIPTSAPEADWRTSEIPRINPWTGFSQPPWFIFGDHAGYGMDTAPGSVGAA